MCARAARRQTSRKLRGLAEEVERGAAEAREALDALDALDARLTEVEAAAAATAGEIGCDLHEGAARDARAGKVDGVVRETAAGLAEAYASVGRRDVTDRTGRLVECLRGLVVRGAADVCARACVRV